MVDEFRKVIELVRTRKWDTLIFIGMMVVLALIVPFAVRGFVADAISQQFEPVIESIAETRDSIQALEEFNVVSLRNSALVAYNKIETVDDLEPLTQNGLAIREALKVPEIREVLASVDLERTRAFERYFAGE